MSTYISAFTLEQDQEKAAHIALAIEEVVTTLHQRAAKEKDDTTGTGVENILSCLSEQVWRLHDAIEEMKWWAEQVGLEVGIGRTQVPPPMHYRLNKVTA